LKEKQKTFPYLFVIRSTGRNVGELIFIDGEESRKLFPVWILRRNGHEYIEILHTDTERWLTIRKLFIEKGIKGRFREEGSTTSFVFMLGA